MTNKKGDISIAVIVAAAIALVVLIVIAIVFTSSTSEKARQIDERSSGFISTCEKYGEGQKSTNWRIDCWRNETYKMLVSNANDNPGMKCCICPKDKTCAE